jgi:hypothetical protein
VVSPCSILPPPSSLCAIFKNIIIQICIFNCVKYEIA